MISLAASASKSRWIASRESGTCRQASTSYSPASPDGLKYFSRKADREISGCLHCRRSRRRCSGSF